MAEPGISWSPTEKFKQSLTLTSLMAEVGVGDFEALHKWSVENPEAFWESTIKRLGIQFKTPHTTLLDTTDGVSKAKWLVGAEMNIADSCFAGDLSRPALITRRYDGATQTISFDELDRLSNRIANGLASINISKGDAVAIDMAMTAEAVAIYLGVIKAGAAVISVPDSFPEGEIAKRLRIGDAKAVFTQDIMPRGEKKLPMAEKVKAAADGLPVVILPACGEMSISLTGSDIAWDHFLSSNDSFESITCTPDDIINILFSSGTTGDPKAIPWTHSTPIKCGSDAYYHHNITTDDVVCWPTSLGWMMGPWLIFASFLNGAPMALYEGGPVEREFCQFVADTKVTMMGLVPSIAGGWRVSGCADGLDFSSITRYSSSGEASNADDYAWLMQLGQPSGKTVPIVEYCGGTEMAGAYLTSTLLTKNQPAQFGSKALGMDFVILNEDATPCDKGQAGEVFLVPPSIGLSTRILNRDNEEVYYKDCPSWQGKLLRRHGDRIVQLDNGNYGSDGRADNAMNLGGIKIGSAEIERVVGVVDSVIETAAIGIPPIGGGPDQLVVYAVLKGTPDIAELKTAMQIEIKTKLNPLFKITDVVAINKLPRTASNKVMHRELKKQYQAKVAA